LSPYEEEIKNHYSQNAEWERLYRNAWHRLEYDTTLYFLKKYLPSQGRVLDAGGGPGRYTIALAQLGYDMVLFDLTPKLLEIARHTRALSDRNYGWLRGLSIVAFQGNTGVVWSGNECVGELVERAPHSMYTSCGCRDQCAFHGDLSKIIQI
jgi:SAM-dependent methyltransferase